jgi:hypothetical protein
MGRQYALRLPLNAGRHVLIVSGNGTLPHLTMTSPEMTNRLYGAVGETWPAGAGVSAVNVESSIVSGMRKKRVYVGVLNVITCVVMPALPPLTP